MTIPHDPVPEALAACPPGITAPEWEARLQLAACYRIFDLWGWSEGIYNHISLRVPGPDHHFLLNPFGLHYSEVTASNLVKVDLDGRLLSDSPWPINPAGFTPHATLHRHLDGARCVMHTHTTAGMAVACSAEGLSITNFYAAQLSDRVAYHDFEGITLHADEGPRLLASVGERQAVVLRNHGLLVWSETLPKALYTLWALQRACEVQVAGAALGLRQPIAESVRQGCVEDARRFLRGDAMGQDLFAAMLRRIDRLDPTWKQ
ncbi:class II aldolase/adducin family protein [Pseudorhodoferax sp. Leaf274]|uniref:class II aldolase/adducin family protein n=1 Tax=Pseudorhodoferax sp. Leaf274 TaxID=1736318 RepID=UPI0009E9846A|nr:class II aldolase/adducin family protein [Pseudorhodoferax sp. Leaf274]